MKINLSQKIITTNGNSLCSTEENDETNSSVVVTNIDEKTFLPQTISTEDISESSDETDGDEIRRHGGYIHPLFESYNDPKQEDIYADVREKMEKLARADRDKHFHLAKGVEDVPSRQIAIPFYVAFTTYFSYVVLIIFGHVRDLFGNLFRKGRYLPSQNFPSDYESQYAPIFKNRENFYTRRLYHRLQDCFNRPISSNPGSFISVLERVSEDGYKTMKVLGAPPKEGKFCDKGYVDGEYAVLDEGRVARKCLNLGSYNYLGFGDDWNDTCASSVLPTLEQVPVSCTSPRIEAGTTVQHEDLEKLIGEFLGKESVFVHNMGYNTNGTTIPALVGKGDLIISDELNHTSICNGARASGANIRIFRHNDVSHLEEIIKDAIIMGRPRTRRPFHKILVIVEGIYSMEGEYCNLGPINRVCKKYGAYLYLDEAHSIGAMGPTGRGCTEYWGVNDVDVMMGTFSKSFGAMGGYVAGKKEIIDSIRVSCSGSIYHNSLSPVVTEQIMTALKIIMGKDGTSLGRQKIDALRDNSNYFRMRLNEMNLHVLGNYDSPVMPIMLFNPAKIATFSRECFKRGIAVVVVGFPAVPVIESRARFCISATHKREDLDEALDKIEQIADIIGLKYKTTA